jgi:cell division protease FtsH
MLSIFKYFYKRLKALMKRMKEMGVGKNLLFVFGMCYVAYYIKHHPQPVATSEFIKELDKSLVGDVNILNDTILFTWKNNTYFTNTSEAFNQMIVSRLMKKGIGFNVTSNWLMTLMHNPSSKILLGTMFTTMIGMSIFSTLETKMKKKKVETKDVFTNFIGRSDTVKTLELIIDQLRNPDKYLEKNIKLIKGVLLYGKPGTGKTLIARVITN